MTTLSRFGSTNILFQISMKQDFLSRNEPLKQKRIKQNFHQQCLCDSVHKITYILGIKYIVIALKITLPHQKILTPFQNLH